MMMIVYYKTFIRLLAAGKGKSILYYFLDDSHLVYEGAESFILDGAHLNL